LPLLETRGGIYHARLRSAFSDALWNLSPLPPGTASGASQRVAHGPRLIIFATAV
jgi:hypothetical protein